MKKIGVYGSLRKGMYNHILLDNEESHYLRTEQLEIPFKMIPYSSFPALIPDDKTNKIEMEIYEVSDLVYQNVERLEGYPSFYDKESIIDKESGDPIEFYVIRDPYNRYRESFAEQESIVDWVSYYNEHHTRY